MKRWQFRSAGVAWVIAGAALLRGSLYNEVPPYWVGVAFLLGGLFVLVYELWTRRKPSS